MASAEEPERPWMRFVSWLSGLAILAAVVLVTARVGELRTFIELITQAEPRWLGLALALQASTYVSSAAVWWRTLRRGGSPLAMQTLVTLSLAKLFTDQVLPSGGLSGSLLLTERLLRRGVSEGVAMAALLLGLIGYYGAYALMVVASLLVLPPSFLLHPLPPPWLKGVIHPLSLALGTTLLVVAFGIPVFVLRLRRLDASLPGWLAAVPGVRSLLAAMVAAPTDLLRSPWLITRAIAFEGLVFLADAATLFGRRKARQPPQLGAPPPRAAGRSRRSTACRRSQRVRETGRRSSGPPRRRRARPPPRR